MRNIAKRFIVLATLLGALVIIPVVQAATITGEINFAGSFLPTGGTDLSDATGIDFVGDNFVVTGVTDDFSSYIALYDIGLITDFNFADEPFISVNPLWTIGGFSFELTNVIVVTQTADYLNIKGSGVITGNGFTATRGSWSLSGEAGVQTFGWSSTAVSEPLSLVLMGLGLVGLGTIARRRKAASKFI